jgi:TetR/AcrR family transcriptional repressor of nem operon
MTKGEKSRLLIITKSAAIFNRLGYSSTSLATIMEATNFEKGGIYKHFKTKENLALEAFIYAYRLCYQKLLKPLASLSTGLEKIDGFIENFGDLPGELTGGCPIFNTGMDGGNLNVPLKKEAKKAYDLWISELSQFIDQAKQEGDLPKSISTPVTANFITGSRFLYGCILQMRRVISANREGYPNFLGSSPMIDSERFKLLYGPNQVPKCRLGDKLLCEYRDREVMVKAMTDAPIQWPSAYRGKRRGPIVCGDLVRAIRR